MKSDGSERTKLSDDKIGSLVVAGDLIFLQ
ncbi:hypothetical protein [Brevibacillus ruminantium]